MQTRVLNYSDGGLIDTPYSHIIAHNRKLLGDLHTHTFYEIFLLISGTVTHEFNGREQLLRDGDMMFLSPGDMHQYHENSLEIELLSLQIATEEMQRFLDAYDIHSIVSGAERLAFITLNRSEVRAITDISNRMVAQTREDQRILYRLLLGKIMHCYLNRALQGDLPPWLKIAMDQMRSVRNASEGVSALLRLSNLSHAQLCRLMKKHCGTTPQQFVKDLRLSLAYQMIESTDDDFLSISMEVGYNSFSHFCSTFKEKYGISPSELRRQMLIRLAAAPNTPGKD